MIELNDVHRVFEGEQAVAALAGVSLDVRDASMVAIMGPSGSGKSTLLNLLGCLDRPTSGRILFDGLDVGALDEDARTDLRAARIGFVFQAFNLLPTLSAHENVELPLLLTNVPRHEATDRAHDALTRVGLGPRAGHLPDALSAGEQQRVAIARAVVSKPSLLLADEPTGNLDTPTGEEVVALIRAMQRELSSIVVLVTHDPQVAATCDRIVYLRDGRIVGTEELTPPTSIPPLQR